MFPASTTKGSTVLSFPDVCKVPAPPAPFEPVPYPNTQFQENLKVANKVDAMAKAGNREAQQKKQQAIGNLFSQTGIKAISATQAVMLGKTAHGNQDYKINIVQQKSRNVSMVSNTTKSAHNMVSSIINNIRA